MPETVYLHELLESPEMNGNFFSLPIALGRDADGCPIIEDMARMPHLIIAGQTGSGKSVCTHSIIASILHCSAPEDVRMLLVDTKCVEYFVYNDLPHMLVPMLTDPMKAVNALKWAVDQMNDRFKLLSGRGVRNIEKFNEALAPGEEKMPRLVIFIDDLADLMMVSPTETEETISRLAQLGRAVGIHLVLVTQKPYTGVLTGAIRANIPARIAFRLPTADQSRTVIDRTGAETLLGMGDMILIFSEYRTPVRGQGAWISYDEVEAIVSRAKSRWKTCDQDAMDGTIPARR